MKLKLPQFSFPVWMIIILASSIVILKVSSPLLEEQPPTPLSAQQLTCEPYDSSRGARIANAYDTYVMEYPEKSKDQILQLLSETTKETGLEADLELLVERLASGFRFQEKLKESLDVYELLLGKLTQLYGANSLNLEETLNAEAEVFRLSKDFASAEDRLLRVYEIKKAFYERAKQNPNQKPENVREYEADLANALDRLVHLHLNAKNFTAAQKYMQQVLEIRVRVYGAKSDYLASTYVEIGDLYQAMGDKQAALDHYKAALAIADRTHPAGSLARELRGRISEICNPKPPK